MEEIKRKQTSDSMQQNDDIDKNACVFSNIKQTNARKMTNKY